jgi:UDP-MurNAc hydroxylase
VAARIEWVNHASFIYDDGHIRLISDPWLEGRTFYNGWDLLAPTAMSFDEFATITHIWISHEHPDHLSPPNLARIAPDVRARITVLYQATPVRRVLKYLASLGFREVVELQPQWTPLSPETDVLCGPCRTSTSDDSYLALRTDGKTTLNLNDCAPSGVAGIRSIKALVGPPDVLLAQFSIACWTGNRDQYDKRALASRMVENSYLLNVRELAAPFVIPAASFSWFCNVENSWMNETAPRVEAIAQETREAGSTPVVLYPGDVWELCAPHDNRSAIERYNARYARTEEPEGLFANPTVEIATLKAHALTFGEKIRKANQAMLLRLLRPAKIFLDDHGAAFSFCLRDGLREISEARENCDVALGSDGLDYCFKYLWGGDTLNINGRFEKPPRGKFSRFRVYFAIASLNNAGVRFDTTYLARNAAVVFAKFFEYRRGNDSLKPTV